MKLQRNELIIIAVVIGYIAFFTHPVPSYISNLLESSIGRAIILLGILYVIAYQSLIVGIFLGIAYIMTASRITEHLNGNPRKIPVAKPTGPMPLGASNIPVAKPTGPMPLGASNIPVAKPTGPMPLGASNIPVPKPTGPMPLGASNIPVPKPTGPTVSKSIAYNTF